MRRRDPHGIALVLVLGVLTITLAVGYAMIRTAGLGSSLQVNFERQAAARAAARTGMNLAVHHMHQASWGGVGSEFRRTLSAGVQFTATYSAGDASLTAAAADYDKLPYRVTIHVVGTADHPLHAGAPATAELSAVVQLIPRKLQDPSVANRAADPFVVYHWSDRPLELDLPSRLDGPVYTQGAFDFLPSYPVESIRTFRGHVDEVALLGKALSSAQVQAIYAAASSGTAAAQYASHQPLAWWRFDEATDAQTAVDQRGTTHGVYAGALSGQSQVPFSSANRSTYLDGYHANIRCGNVDPSGQRLTILLWVRPEQLASSTVRLVTSAFDTSDWGHDFAVSVVPRDGGQRLRLQWRNSILVSSCDANAPLTVGQWTFVAAVIDGNVATLYQNGTAVGQGYALLLPTFSAISRVMIGDSYPGSSRSQLLRDQYQLHAAGGEDLRVLTGPLHVPSDKLTAATRSLCNVDLAVAVQDVPAISVAPLTIPVNVSHYRLYPGGPQYAVPSLDGSLTSRTLTPDPASNPLGIYRLRGDATLNSDVTFQGTLLFDSGSARLRFRGQRIQGTSVTLPILEGEVTARQLPLALVPGETIVEDSAGDISLTGQWLTGGPFEYRSGGSSMSFLLRGALVTERLRVQRRTNWPTSESNWRALLSGFFSQGTQPGGTRYFPLYLEQAGYDPTPTFIIQPPEAPSAGYLWPDFSQPLLEAHPDDGGLRWKWVRWDRS